MNSCLNGWSVIQKLCKITQKLDIYSSYNEDQTWAFVTRFPVEIGIKRLYTASKYNVRLWSDTMFTNMCLRVLLNRQIYVS